VKRAAGQLVFGRPSPIQHRSGFFFWAHLDLSIKSVG
jgi:hypothetical protein